MCTVVVLKTFSNWNKEVASTYRSSLRDILTHRGRDVWSIVVYRVDGRLALEEKRYFFDDVEECLNKIISCEGENLITIFGRATPETENRNLPQQPYIYNSNNNKKHILLHHGLYSNAPEDSYDSAELFKLMSRDYNKFLTELLYNSSFLLLDIMPMNQVSVYKGQFEFGEITTSHFQVIGTIPYRYCHVPCPAYSKALFTYNLREQRFIFKGIVPLSPLAGIFDNATAYDKSPIILPQPARLAALYSSGMDIFVSVNYLLDKVAIFKELHLFNLDYGQYANEAEWEYTQRAADYFKNKYNIKVLTHHLDIALQVPESNIIKGSKSDRESVHREAESDSNYVPMRNLQFVANIAPLCEQLGIHGLCIGLNLSEGMTYCDNATVFYYNLNSVLQCCGKRGYSLNLLAPLIHMTKTDIIRLAYENGYDLNYSWSCYYPKKTKNGFKPCGECGSCLLRKVAIERAIGQHPRAHEK